MKNARSDYRASLLALAALALNLFVVSSSAYAFTRWWAPQGETKLALAQALRAKVGEVETPEYPANAILNWSTSQFPNPERGLKGIEGEAYRQKIARAVYEHVLVADDILKKAQTISEPAALAQQHRRVILLAEAAALHAAVVLNDYSLVALIREAYQLPYLEAATSDADSPISKEHIIEAVGAAYERTQATDKEIAAFRLLIQVASNRNTADSGRSKIGQAYARKGDYARAIAYLEAIKDPSVGGAKRLIAKYQALQNQQQANNTK